ncbi:MAG: class I SAM-dependent methyltransferase [Dehalococcoidales bacterium]
MSTTRDTYNRIASSRYNFRHYSRFQSELEDLTRRWQKGKLLNVGCAHGPDFIPFKNSFELHGVDYSIEMLELAKKYAMKNQFRVNLVEADARQLPYANDFFDFAIAIAVYHHIEDKDGRLKALKELYRVLKPGGEAFITVWNRWQPRHWLQKKSFMHPWVVKGEKLYRFYYLFTYGELEKLAHEAGFEIIKSSPEARYKFPLKTFSRNICLLVRKNLVSIAPPLPTTFFRP